jgi:hypothetical protein
MPQTPHSLSTIIQACKPRAALITSYTFSPSYFEATILNKLKQSGCQDVVLLVDQNEVLSTLAESRSLGAGRSYRLLSVASPGGGFFHPKIAYLECEDDDILVIGSGNLTFSGQGSNLECIDAVKCSKHPEIFADLARWLEALSMADVLPSVAIQLQQFYRRAQTQAKKFANDNPRVAWLIHTAHQTAFDQLAEIALGVGSWTSLTALSPFHAPDGSTILQLAKAIGVSCLEIGLNPQNLEVALDEQQFKSDLPVRYVLPDSERERNLHAKWFELRSEGRALIMSGSVNATPQSMQSLKNVEISLVRLLTQPPFNWDEGTPACFSPNSYTPPVTKANSIGLDANYFSDTKIAIVLHKACKSQLVTAELRCAGKTLQTWQALALLNGVDISLPRVNEAILKCKMAITIQIQGLDFLAGGYLNIEPELTGQELNNDYHAALARMAEGQEQAGDGIFFLQLLLQLAHKKTQHTAPSKTQIQENQPPTEPDNSQFSYRDWVGSGKTGSQNSASISHDRLIKSLASIFFPNVVPDTDGNKPPRRLLGEDNRGRNDWGDSSRDWAGEEQEQRADLSANLREIIPAILRSDKAHAYATPLLLFLLAGAMHRYQLLIRQGNAELACTQCMNWLQLCSELEMTAETRTKILPNAVALAALVAHYYQLAGSAPPLERLRALLDPIVNDQFSADDLSIHIMEAEEQVLFSRLSAADKVAISAQAPHLANAASIEEMLVKLVIQASQDPAWRPDAISAAMFPGIAEKLRCRANNRKPLFGMLRGAINGKHSCPCCYVSLDAGFSQILKQKHALICRQPTCGKVILSIQNQFFMKKLIEGTTHV